MYKQPDLIDDFSYRGEKIDVKWFDISSKEDIPDLPWQQVYAIGDLDGKVPVVFYGGDARDNLPGGHVEPGESVEQTLVREIDEELNCEVLEWQPLGYQILTSEKHGTVYQMRVFAKLKKLGEFKFDIGGSVKGYKLVELGDLNGYIDYRNVGKRLIS